MTILEDVKNLANDSLKHWRRDRQTPLSEKFEQIVKMKQAPICVAGNTTDFVNHVLDNVASGQEDGGLGPSHQNRETIGKK